MKTNKLISALLVFAFIFTLLPLGAIIVDADIDSYFEIVDGVLVKYYGTNQKAIIPDGVHTLGYDCFAYNSDISEVVIPSGVLYLDQGVFFDCANLRSIVVPSSVIEIGEYAFECNEFVTIYCGKDSVAYEYAVENNIAVFTYSPPNMIKEAKLKPFDNFDLTVSVTSIGDRFSNEGSFTMSYYDGKPTEKTIYYFPGATFTFNKDVILQEFGLSVIDFSYNAGTRINTNSAYGYEFCLVLTSDGSVCDLNTEYHMSSFSRIDDTYFLLWFVPVYKPSSFASLPSVTDLIYVEKPAAASPTASTVIVNGKNVAFDAYNINGNNYFKLRDLAFILSGTEKQFEVGWDADNNAISLTSGKAYTAVGGEMEGKGAGSKIANPTSSKIYLDGKEISLTAYNIGGNNYFKLRDVGQTFDFGVTWDGAKNTIVIDTSMGYTPE